MAIPIIFVHSGNPFYLKYTLKQAKYFNPDSEIYLLGDDSNNQYSFVNHINVSQYPASADAFAGVYKHLSSNIYNYELFCFQRWFIIRDFAKANKIESFIYLDSDVLAYCDFSKAITQLKNVEIANTGKGIGMPAFSYFNSYKAIDNFCNYLTNYYTQSDLINKLGDWYDMFLKQSNPVGGICDMTIFDFFFKENPTTTSKIDQLGEICFDSNISDTAGYEEENGMKRVYWKNKLPYCKSLEDGKLNQFATLHYQGHVKKLIIQHFLVNGYTVVKLKDQFTLIKTQIDHKIQRFVKDLIGYKNK